MGTENPFNYTKRDFRPAITMLDKLLSTLAENDSDRVAALRLKERCVQYLECPPKCKWDGSYKMDRK